MGSRFLRWENPKIRIQRQRKPVQCGLAGRLHISRQEVCRSNGSLPSENILEAQGMSHGTDVVDLCCVVFAKGVLHPEVPVNRIWVLDIGRDPVGRSGKCFGLVKVVTPLPPVPTKPPLARKFGESGTPELVDPTCGGTARIPILS